MTSRRYRTIRISGDRAQRAHQYGEQARDQILATRAGYERAFASKGITWGEAVAFARQFLPHIEGWRPELLTEIEGIAHGADLKSDDVLAINCRTEILWSAARRDADALAQTFFGECSSFALHSDAMTEGLTLVGQNWDWLDTLSDGVIVLEVERPDEPNYVTVVEAGLLAKTSLTQAGIAFALNTLVSSLDGGTVGIPFHFLIRDIVDSEHVSDALTKLSLAPRASSGNYVLGSSDGAVLNIETAPGDARNVFAITLDNGAVVHTNHFLREIRGGFDLAPSQMADSFVRYGRMRELIQEAPKSMSSDRVREILADHTDAPSSICCHPDERSDRNSQWATLVAAILDPKNKVMHLAEGSPCSTPWVRLDFSELLG